MLTTVKCCLCVVDREFVRYGRIFCLRVSWVHAAVLANWYRKHGLLRYVATWISRFYTVKYWRRWLLIRGPIGCVGDLWPGHGMTNSLAKTLIQSIAYFCSTNLKAGGRANIGTGEFLVYHS